MSGGAFVSRTRIEQMADELDKVADHIEETDLSPEAVEKLEHVSDDLEDLCPLVHAADYHACGDYGTDTFAEKVKAWEEDNL